VFGIAPFRRMAERPVSACPESALVFKLSAQNSIAFTVTFCTMRKKYRIEIDAATNYLESQSSPEADRYVFAYTITIRNAGEAPARLIARHWIITDAHGKVQEVRGDGVVGEKPRLTPGESFRYTSAAMIETPVGTMRGAYQMVDDEGEYFDAEIPAFTLAIPRTLH
jgi:ApaG protein